MSDLNLHFCDFCDKRDLKPTKFTGVVLKTDSNKIFVGDIVTHLTLKEYCCLHKYTILTYPIAVTVAKDSEKTNLI